MITLLKSITKKEWLFVAFISLVVILLTIAPLIYGFLIRPPDSIFTGTHFTPTNDWFVYYSHIEQARQGNFLFKNLYASEPHLPSLYLFWLGVGNLARIFNLSNIVAYNGVRIFLIPVFYFIAYLLIAYIFSDIKKRKISLLLLSFSSGLGVFFLGRIIKYPFNYANGQFNWPMDLWVPESNTFLTLYYSGHFITSLILILVIFLLTMLFVDNKKFIYGLWAGSATLTLITFHPFHLLTVFSVILVYFVLLTIREKKILWHLIFYYLTLGLFSLPPTLYFLYLLRVDWVTSIRAIQNMCFTTPLWLTFFSYGLLIIFALLGFYFLFKEKGGKNLFYSNKILFILVWLMVQSLMIYFPVNFQRRLSEGLHFPLVFFTTIGLFSLYTLINKRENRLTEFLFNQRYLLLLFLIIFLPLSNLFQIAVDSFLYSDRRESSFAYLEKEAVEAATWLKTIPRDKIIFNSANNVINFIPAFSGRTVYVGHGVETPFFGEKQKEVDWFFAKNRPEEIERNFLIKRNIDYIFYSDDERKLGDYNPENKSYLKEVYSNPKVKIYQVL